MQRSEAEYLAGITTFDITPPVGSPLAGFAARGIHSSTGIYHPLRGCAVSLGDGNYDVVIISLELLGTYEDLADLIAAAIAERTGLARERILINSSHTHCGPAVRHADRDWHGWIDEDYRAALPDRVAVAAARALEHRFPAVLRRGVGHSQMGVNRRRPDPDRPGRVDRSMRPYPEGPADPEVPVLVISSAEDSAVRAVLFSYPCHPTSRGGLRIGGDYVGFALDAVGEAFPYAQPVFLQGCGGDQKPAPTDRSSTVFDARSEAEVQLAGEDLASGVIAAAQGDLVEVSGPVAAAFGTIDLVAEPVTAEAIAEGAASASRHVRDWSRTWSERLAAGETDHTVRPFELQVVRIGDLALVGMGAEMTVEHGLRLKRELPTTCRDLAQVIPLGYSNHMIGYVPVARQFDEYGYEVYDSQLYHGHSGRWLPETEDKIHTSIGILANEAR